MNKDISWFVVMPIKYTLIFFIMTYLFIGATLAADQVFKGQLFYRASNQDANYKTSKEACLALGGAGDAQQFVGSGKDYSGFDHNCIYKDPQGETHEIGLMYVEFICPENSTTSGVNFDECHCKDDYVYSNGACLDSASATQGVPSVTPLAQPSSNGADESTSEPWSRARIAKIAKRSVIVGMYAKVTVSAGSALQGLKLPAAFSLLPDEQAIALGNDGKAAVLPEVKVKKGHQSSSGYLLNPPANSSTLEFVTWNTGEPVKDFNASHAEHQFISYIEDAGSWLSRIKSIDVQVFGLDVCYQCEHDLQRLETIVKSRNPKATVSWRRVD